MTSTETLIEEAVAEYLEKMIKADMPGLENDDIPNSIKKNARKVFVKRIKPILTEFAYTIATKSAGVETNRCVQIVHKIAVLGTADHTNREIKLLDTVIEALSHKE